MIVPPVSARLQGILLSPQFPSYTLRLGGHESLSGQNNCMVILKNTHQRRGCTCRRLVTSFNASWDHEQRGMLYWDAQYLGYSRTEKNAVDFEDYLRAKAGESRMRLHYSGTKFYDGNTDASTS
jgi:hypothetical protein